MSKRRSIQRGGREHYRRSCKRKRRYPDEVTVIAFAVHQVEEGRADALTWYACRFCFGWHLATDKSKQHKAGQ